MERGQVRIAVTGATGAVGGMVARSLARLGMPICLVIRDPGRGPLVGGVETAFASYDDLEAMTTALAGTSAMLFVSGREHRTAHRVSRSNGRGGVRLSRPLSRARVRSGRLGDLLPSDRRR